MPAGSTRSVPSLTDVSLQLSFAGQLMGIYRNQPPILRYFEHGILLNGQISGQFRSFVVVNYFWKPTIWTIWQAGHLAIGFQEISNETYRNPSNLRSRESCLNGYKYTVSWRRTPADLGILSQPIEFGDYLGPVGRLPPRDPLSQFFHIYELKTSDYPALNAETGAFLLGNWSFQILRQPDNTPIDNDIDWVWWLLIVPVLIWERLTNMVSLLDLLALQCNLLLSNGCSSSGNLTNMACLKRGYPIMRWS